MPPRPPAPPRASLVALAFVGCNMVCGLEEPTLRAGGGGAGGGGGGAPPEGGGGAVPAGGSGGDGGAAGAEAGGGAGGAMCPTEQPSLQGTEIVLNRSFESFASSWMVTGGFPALSFDSDSFCGCTAATLTLPGGYGEVRSTSLVPVAAGSTLRLRARMRAPDSVAADIVIRGDAVNVEPPFNFQVDSADGATDGWRLAEGTTTTSTDLSAAGLVIELDGSAGVEVAFDCISATWE